MENLSVILDFLAKLVALLALCGFVSIVSGAVAVQRFAARPRGNARDRPAVTVLKPLCGDEPLLEAALTTICGQAYPEFQIVFGVQDPNDVALQVVQRIRARFPGCDISVVVGPASHGQNRKVSNLINMMPTARHDVLVISDSDLHVPPDYLERIVAELETPFAGLVTTLCVGLPTTPGIAARLGATGISHLFLPGALLSRALGREDCLGTTMALRRETLAQVGGLDVLAGHLADDNALAKQVHKLGLRVVLAATVPMTSVPERSLRKLWQHEQRWARTIRALEPLLYATSAVQYPITWAALSVVLSGGSPWSAGLFAAAWWLRAAAALSTDWALLRGRAKGGAAPIHLLPLRDLFSVTLIIASFLGARVVWRGHVMHADKGVSSKSFSGV